MKEATTETQVGSFQARAPYTPEGQHSPALSLAWQFKQAVLRRTRDVDTPPSSTYCKLISVVGSDDFFTTSRQDQFGRLILFSFTTIL
jgi:hypothetical protein